MHALILPHTVCMYTSVHYMKVPPHIRASHIDISPIAKLKTLQCIGLSFRQPMSQWPALATLYCPLVTLCTLLSFTLYILHFTQQFTLPCPHKFQPTSFVVPSSLLSDFAPVYNLSNASLFNPPNLLQLFTYLQYQISICVHPSLKNFSTSQSASWSSF